MPGVLRHLINLEAHCNNKFKHFEQEITELKNQLAQCQSVTAVSDRLPELHELFPIPNDYFFNSVLETKLSRTLNHKFEGLQVLELSSQAGERAQFLRRFPIKSYIGFETSTCLVKFAKNNIADVRFNFQIGSFDSALESQRKEFGLILFLPTKKSFDLAQFERNVRLGLASLSSDGLFIVEPPYPITDIEALGFNIVDLIRSSGFEVRQENNMLIVESKELAYVAVSQ